EAEGELVGGFHTEYSTLKFALFFLAEYVNMVTVSALATTLFLGGWRAPWPISPWDGANTGYWPVLWFLGKTRLFIFMYVWLRGTLPRFRYDQFMHFGWKVLIPVALVWTVAVAFIRRLRLEGGVDTQKLLIFGGIAVAVLLVIAFLPERPKPEPPSEEAEFDPYAGGYPVPPMPGQRSTDQQSRENSAVQSETESREHA